MDNAAGKITKVAKTMAQLRQAQGSQSFLALRMQIDLAEHAIEVMRAEGDAIEDITKREEHLAALREKLKITTSIIRDASPHKAAIAPKLPDTSLPGAKGAKKVGEQAGEEFALAFIELAEKRLALGADFIGDTIQELADGIDMVGEAVRGGLEQVGATVDITRNLSNGTYSGLQAQHGFADNEQTELMAEIAKSNQDILRKMGKGGLFVI